jgi:hypothetical protein
MISAQREAIEAQASPADAGAAEASSAAGWSKALAAGTHEGLIARADL